MVNPSGDPIPSPPDIFPESDDPWMDSIFPGDMGPRCPSSRDDFCKASIIFFVILSLFFLDVFFAQTKNQILCESAFVCDEKLCLSDV